MSILPPLESYEGMDREMGCFGAVFVVIIIILVLGLAFSDSIDKKFGRGKYAPKKEETINAPTASTWNERIEDEIRKNKLEFQRVQEEKKKLMLEQWHEFVFDREQYDEIRQKPLR